MISVYKRITFNGYKFESPKAIMKGDNQNEDEFLKEDFWRNFQCCN